jgi:hypothetical protein
MGASDHHENRRRDLRLRTLKGATIVNNGTSLINCVVRDLSTTGARIQVEGAATIPERFILVIGRDASRQEWAAQVVWRGVSELGVSFL